MGKVHAQKRIEERYFKELGLDALIKMRDKIKKGDAIFVNFSDKNPTRLFYYVTYNHIPYKVLYDTAGGYIVTVYNFDVDEYNKLLDEKRKELDTLEFLKGIGIKVGERNGISTSTTTETEN